MTPSSEDRLSLLMGFGKELRALLWLVDASALVQKMRALVSAHRDRDKQKRDFHRLWITQINAVTRENGKNCGGPSREAQEIHLKDPLDKGPRRMARLTRDITLFIIEYD
ncbi:hypothetical protein QJS10_CPB12g01429 [Acorus calamus]|uniref:Large ribosomal subunit protein bL20c n=1 Tax=Acorus calamus TaxID=4465 RepID=A0AAV9DLQ7_ACOCL|nr:hypothetical protein QJS10_CPB12g01429 [Acorus calamus]